MMIFKKEIINARKLKTAKALDQVITDQDVVLVCAGVPVQKPGGHDQTYPFLPHPDYFWLTGYRRQEGISAYTKSEGWIDFVLPVSREERIWEGHSEDLEGRNLNEFQNWLNKRRTITLAQGSQSLDEANLDVQEAFNEVRRVKDAAEVALISNIALMAAKGYERLKTFISPGVSERDVQLEYETAVLKAGSEKFPYDTIVGTGTNAAILHAIPTSRIVKKEDLVLIDAGADVADYCVDITRVFSASRKFSEQQQAVYDLVLSAQKKSISLCKAGTPWSEVHLASARTIASGLKDMSLLNCDAETALTSGAISVFFPHGVGHMVGLKVRDVGEKFNRHPKTYAGTRLRTDITLRDGYLMTVEPGLYFIEALINDDQTRQKYKDLINWNEVTKWLQVGGVRLEDDILITPDGPRNLTEMVEK